LDDTTARHLAEADLRVLIASPVRKPAMISWEFIQGLGGLEHPCPADWAFIDDCEDADAAALLRAVRPPHGGYAFVLDVDDQDSRPAFATAETRQWTAAAWERVAGLRNRLLRFALDGPGLWYSHVLLVDADLVLHPRTLAFLLAAGKDIVSEVFWSRWTPTDMEAPNVWASDHYNLFDYTRGEGALDRVEFEVRRRRWLGRLRRPGLHRVGGLGACTLISRRALEAGVDYTPLYNLTWWGEDRHFCLRAAALGFELWADTHCPALHLYREDDLALVPVWRRRWAEEAGADSAAGVVRG
jgi:hypothetical protein